MDDAALTQHLRSLEERLLQPDVRRSAQELQALLADEFTEFTSSGRVCDKQEMVERLPSATPVPMTLTDFQARRLAPDVALTTFTLVKHQGRPRRSLRSSIWTCIDGQWQMLFHQGTPAAEE